MSDLKHLTITLLEKRREETIKQIGILNGKINNLQTRLHWIEKYIVDKQEEKNKKVVENLSGLMVQYGYSVEEVENALRKMAKAGITIKD